MVRYSVLIRIAWRYEGDWQDGIRHGKGTWERYDENNTCVEKYLSWRRRYKEFLATLIIYSGEWKDDAWWGYGTVIYNSGYPSLHVFPIISSFIVHMNEYRGNWVSGQREGRGTMISNFILLFCYCILFERSQIWYNRHEIYTGSWEGGQLSGWGTYFWFHQTCWPEDEDGNITRDVLDNHCAEFKTNRYEGNF
jgi:MORN repeat